MSSRSGSRSQAASPLPRTASRRRWLHASPVAIELDDVDVGGVGGTLAANALSMAAMRATLGEVLTEEAFARMIALADRWTAGVEAGIAAVGPTVARHTARLSRGVPLQLRTGPGTEQKRTQRRTSPSSATCTSSR